MKFRIKKLGNIRNETFGYRLIELGKRIIGTLF
jgi:hypothetical protein